MLFESIVLAFVGAACVLGSHFCSSPPTAYILSGIGALLCYVAGRLLA